MMTDQLAAAVTFAASFVAFFVAHQFCDHWVQTDCQARTKSVPGWTGHLACARHVAGYTAGTTLAVLVVVAAFGLPASPAGIVAGQLVSAVTHYWADRRHTLAWLARLAGKAPFLALGVPREGKDDNPSLGTGAYALDQSFHYLWLFAGALITALA